MTDLKSHNRGRLYKRFIFVIIIFFFFMLNITSLRSQKLNFPKFTSLPSENGWNYYIGSDYVGIEPPYFSIEDEVLLQRTGGEDEDTHGYFAIPRGKVISTNTNWTLKIRARIIHIENYNKKFQFWFSVTQNDLCYSVTIHEAKIYIWNSEPKKFVTISNNNMVFHDFVLTGGPDANWSFYIDGSKVAEGYPVLASKITYKKWVSSFCGEDIHPPPNM